MDGPLATLPRQCAKTPVNKPLNMLSYMDKRILWPFAGTTLVPTGSPKSDAMGELVNNL